MTGRIYLRWWRSNAAVTPAFAAVHVQLRDDAASLTVRVSNPAVSWRGSGRYRGQLRNEENKQWIASAQV
jgi:hypothetical protein